MNLKKRLTVNSTTLEKKVCKECTKAAVIIENKIYFCGECYCRIKGIPKKHGKIQLF